MGSGRTCARAAQPSLRPQLKQSDGDEVRNGVYISDEEEHELSGSKARAQRARGRRPPREPRRARAGTPPCAHARAVRALTPRRGWLSCAQGTAHFVFSWPEIKKQARARARTPRAHAAASAAWHMPTAHPAERTARLRPPARAQCHVNVIDVKKARHARQRPCLHAPPKPTTNHR
jgi:hypothetical protein